MLGGVLQDARAVLDRIVPICYRELRLPSLCTHELSGEGHLRQHHDGGGDGGEVGTSADASDVRTHSSLNPHSLHAAVGLYPCIIVFQCGLKFECLRRSIIYHSRESAYWPFLEEN